MPEKKTFDQLLAEKIEAHHFTRTVCEIEDPVKRNAKMATKRWKSMHPDRVKAANRKWASGKGPGSPRTAKAQHQAMGQGAPGTAPGAQPQARPETRKGPETHRLDKGIPVSRGREGKAPGSRPETQPDA